MTATDVQIANQADEVLLSQAYAGNEQAFEMLFARHYSRIVGVALRIVGSREDAEEIALDAFLKLHEQRIETAEGANVSGWLYRTATNAAFNAIRSRKRRFTWLRRLARFERQRSSDVEDPAIHVERSESAELVRWSLQRLPEKQRNALILRASGLSYKEVANALEIKPGSVGKLLARGEQQLRVIIETERGT